MVESENRSPGADQTSRTGVADPWSLRQWLAIGSLSCGSFALILSEMLPVGTIPLLADQYNITSGQAGQAVTMTALFAAFSALFTAGTFGRADRRVLILTSLAFVIGSNFLVAWSQAAYVLYFARAVLGLAIGSFFSLMGAAVANVVGMPSFGKGISWVFLGLTGASVVAPSMGAAVGESLGVQLVFVTAGAIGVVCAALVSVFLPQLPPGQTMRVSQVAKLGLRRKIQVGLLALMLLFGGNVAGSTYLRSFLEFSGLSDPIVHTVLLLAYGLASLLGNYVGGCVSDRSSVRALSFSAAMVALGTLTVAIGAPIVALLVIAVIVWGTGSGSAPVSIQSYMGRAAPDNLEAVGGLFLAVLQLSIAGGSALAGFAVDAFNPQIAITIAIVGAASTLVVSIIMGKVLGND